MEFFSLINEIFHVVAYLEAQTIGDNKQGFFFLHDCSNPANLCLIITYPVELSDGLCNRRAIEIYTG